MFLFLCLVGVPYFCSHLNFILLYDCDVCLSLHCEFRLMLDVCE